MFPRKQSGDETLARFAIKLSVSDSTLHRMELGRASLDDQQAPDGVGKAEDQTVRGFSG